MHDGIRCSRCAQRLPATSFSPSHRTEGDWCRACRKTYMATYWATNPKPPRPRLCRMCGVEFTRWENWKHPGSAATRCQPCYQQYTRERQTPDGKRRGPHRKPVEVPEYGEPGSSKAWLALRATVIAEEDVCGICGETVDKSLSGKASMGPTVDHIIPTALGGSNHRSNLRLAHRSCNCRMGQSLSHQLLNERAQLLRAALWISERVA